MASLKKMKKNITEDVTGSQAERQHTGIPFCSVLALLTRSSPCNNINFIHVYLLLTSKSTGLVICLMPTSVHLHCWHDAMAATQVKTEALCCQSQPAQCNASWDTSLSLVPVIHDIRVYVDADVLMAAHVTATVRVRFAVLQVIHSMWHSLWHRYVQLTVSRLDYCNSVLIDVSVISVSVALQWRLQSLFNIDAPRIWQTENSAVQWVFWSPDMTHTCHYMYFHPGPFLWKCHFNLSIYKNN